MIDRQHPLPVEKHHIQISMDGNGSWRDNVFAEHLWKSVKYEDDYLHAYDPVADARRGLGRYFLFYNQRRPHSALDGQTPDVVYFGRLLQPRAALTQPGRASLKNVGFCPAPRSQRSCGSKKSD